MASFAFIAYVVYVFISSIILYNVIAYLIFSFYILRLGLFDQIVMDGVTGISHKMDLSRVFGFSSFFFGQIFGIFDDF